MSKSILIAYYTYSRSGNTRRLAELIQQQTGGTLFQMEPAAAYPAAYNACVEQARKEIRAGYRPTLTTKVEGMEAYDTVFAGTPNWWSTIAPPLATFLESYDLSGKTVVPFCSHGGGGGGHIERDIKKLCPNSTVLPGLAVYEGGSSGPQVSTWLRKLGI